jgi:hypothetical protein
MASPRGCAPAALGDFMTLEQISYLSQTIAAVAVRQWWQSARGRYETHVVSLIDGLFAASNADGAPSRLA